MFKRICMFLVGIVLVSGFAIFVIAPDTLYVSSMPSQYERISEERIINSDIAVGMAIDINNSFPQAQDGSIQFPEYFGGMYIDSDGHLVILVVGDAAYNDAYDIFEVLRRRGTAPVTVRQVEHSYATLHDIMDVIIYDLNDSLYRLGPGGCIHMRYVHTISLNTVHNRVEVIIFSESHIDYFRKTVIDHPAIYFDLKDHFLDEWLSILNGA